MPYSDWFALIKELFFKKKKTSFESNRVLWYWGKVFFASNFLISSWISIKTVTNSQQKRFKQLVKISLFAQIFQSLCLRNRINFTSTLYESLKVIIPYNHTRSTLTRNLFFDIEASVNFSRVFCRFLYLQANLWYVSV